jgi:hypothetical protein
MQNDESEVIEEDYYVEESHSQLVSARRDALMPTQ